MQTRHKTFSGFSVGCCIERRLSVTNLSSENNFAVPLISHDLMQNVHKPLAYTRCPANTNDLAMQLCSSCNRRRSMFGLQVVI